MHTEPPERKWLLHLMVPHKWEWHWWGRHRYTVPPMWLLGQLVGLTVPSAAPMIESSLVLQTSQFDLCLLIPLTSGICLLYEMNE